MNFDDNTNIPDLPESNKLPSVKTAFNFENKKAMIMELGDEYESRSENFLLICATRAIRGFFIFKRRKGDLTAGCATFFAILSFCPVLLLLISMMSMTFEGEVARETVMKSLQSSFPHLAKWIFDSINKIVAAKLSGEGSNFANILLLMYSTLGMIASMMFGINVMAKSEQKGGFIFEDSKAIISGLLIYGFMFVLILVTQKAFVANLMPTEDSFVKDAVLFLVNKNIAPIMLSLGFFTLFYKWAPPIKVTWKDSFIGAITFVTCLVCGKSFYWIYLQFARPDIQANYGNFETLITAIMWVYFLMCSFFYGAAMAYMPEETKNASSTPEQDKIGVVAKIKMVSATKTDKSA